MIYILAYALILYLFLGALTSSLVVISLKDTELGEHFKFSTMLIITLFWLPFFLRIWWKARNDD